MPPVVIGAAVGTAVSVGASYVLGSTITTGLILKTFAVNVALGAAQSALAPKPNIPNIGDGGSFSGSKAVNIKQSNATRKIIYGETRTGGVYAFIRATNSDKVLRLAVMLASHEVEEIGNIYFNEVKLTTTVNSATTGTLNVTAPNKYTENTSLQIKLGTDGQAAAGTLKESGSTKWTSDHRLRGIAYIAAALTRRKGNQNDHKEGVPTISAVVKGKKIYDPRTSSTAWSDNPALVIRDYLTDTEFGLGAPASEINDTAFIAAANICDEVVADKSGGTAKRYTFNGVIDTANTPKSNLEQMLSSLAGTIYWSNGQWSLKAGAYITPSVTLDEDDLAGPLQITTENTKRDAFNGVRGQFVGPSTGYQVTDFPEVTNSSFLQADNNEESFINLNLPFTDTSKEAQRIAKLILFKSRQTISVATKFKLTAFQFEVGDTVMLTNSRMGWTQKVFEVVSWSLNFSHENTTVDCLLVETNSDVYAWNAEEDDFEDDDTDLPDPFDIPAPTLSVTEELRIVNEEVLTVFDIDVQSGSIYADRFEVQIKESTKTKYKNIGTGIEGVYEFIGAKDNITYDIRARIINTLGVVSDYATISHDTVGKTAPPANVTNFSVNIVGSQAELSWEPVSDLDLSHYRIRHSSKTTGATYSNATDLIKKVSRPANTAIAPALTGTYMIKAVDKSGIESASATASVAIIDKIEDFNVVATLTQDPSFAGIKTNVVAVENVLKLDTTTDFDDTAGNFDDALSLFDSGFGSVVATGTYEFDNFVDIGSVVTSRVTARMTVDRLDYADSFDAATSNFDDRQGLFDGDADNFGDTDVELQIATTEDDPSSSPTYTDFRKFVVGNYKARAFKFRAILTSTDTDATPVVSVLSVTVDMPDKFISEADIASGAGSKVVSFSPALKSLQGLGISAQNLQSGDYYAITSKTASGFTITFYNSSDAAVDRTFDYVAKGF